MRNTSEQFSTNDAPQERGRLFQVMALTSALTVAHIPGAGESLADENANISYQQKFAELAASLGANEAVSGLGNAFYTADKNGVLFVAPGDNAGTDMANLYTYYFSVINSNASDFALARTALEPILEQMLAGQKRFPQTRAGEMTHVTLPINAQIIEALKKINLDDIHLINKSRAEAQKIVEAPRPRSPQEAMVVELGAKNMGWNFMNGTVGYASVHAGQDPDLSLAVGIIRLYLNSHEHRLYNDARLTQVIGTSALKRLAKRLTDPAITKTAEGERGLRAYFIQNYPADINTDIINLVERKLGSAKSPIEAPKIPEVKYNFRDEAPEKPAPEAPAKAAQTPAAPAPTPKPAAGPKPTPSSKPSTVDDLLELLE